MIYVYIMAGVLWLVGFAVQIFKTLIKKDFALSPILVVLLIAASILFTTGSFLNNNIIPGILNLICTVLAVMILVGLLTMKRID